MVQAIIFDMDGLLIDSEPFWHNAELSVFQNAGLKLSSKDLESTMGMRIDEVVAYWYNKQPWQRTSQKDIEALIIDNVIKLVQNEGVAKPGAIEILKLCKEASLPMAIASSSSVEIINAVVDRLNIRDYFLFTYSAEHEPYGKPHPGIFITTASMLGVPVQDCLVFEDSPYGVLAAKAAKMKCIAVPELNFKNHPYIQIADNIIDTLVGFDKKLLI